MKKKIVRIMTAMAVMALTITPAVANDSTTVEYNVDSEYVVVIPPKAELGESMTITATTINLDYDEAVTVKVASGIENGAVSLGRVGDPDTKITADVTRNNQMISDSSKAVVAQFKGDSKTPVDSTGTLDLSKPKEAYVKAGSYSGTLTFSIALEQGTISSTTDGWQTK